MCPVSTRLLSPCRERPSSRARQAEAFLANQIDAVRSQRSVGPKILALVNAYAAGINGYYRAKGIPTTPFTGNDVIASAALIAARFRHERRPGGAELDVSRRAGGSARRGRRAPSVFADLRESNDPESAVSVPGSFPQQTPASPALGSVVLDDGSFTGAPLAAPAVRLQRAPRRRRKGRRPGTRSSSQARRSATSSRSSLRRWS